MKYAIISDIHSNLEALNAVLEDCQAQGVDNYLCCGDIVGYGADPSSCLEIVRKLNVPCIAGNHDWAVAGLFDASYFTPHAKAAVDWTRNSISKDCINFLAGLSLINKNDDFIMVHGTLNEPEYFHYLSDITHARDTFDLMEQKVCFVGHCHLPRIYVSRYGQVIMAGTEVEIDPLNKYITDVGSVGQPRDGINLSAYTIYDLSLKTIAIRRVSYDIQTARKKILDAGLPEILGNRLLVGK